MSKYFTENDLVRFLYEEVSVQEELAMQWAIDDEPNLAESYKNLEKAKEILCACKPSPSKKNLASLLHYSRQTAMETSSQS